jgi:hypothetical protein
MMAAPMYCTHCGTALPEASRFCSRCGGALEAAVAPAFVAPQSVWPTYDPVPQPQPQPAPPQPQPVPQYVPLHTMPAPAIGVRYRAAGTLAGVLTVLLVFCMIVDSATIISTMLQVDLLENLQRGITYTPEELSANDMRQAIFGGAQFLVYLTTAIVFLWWMARCYRNLPAISSWPRRWGTGWAVGSWFVPFLNLVRPYKIVREAWWVSAHPDEAETPGASPRGTAVMAWWWAFHILMDVLGNIVFRLSMSADTPSELVVFSYVGIAADAVSIVAAIFALAVVNVVTSAQTALARARLGPAAVY